MAKETGRKQNRMERRRKIDKWNIVYYISIGAYVRNKLQHRKKIVFFPLRSALTDFSSKDFSSLLKCVDFRVLLFLMPSHKSCLSNFFRSFFLRGCNYLYFFLFLCSQTNENEIFNHKR